MAMYSSTEERTRGFASEFSLLGPSEVFFGDRRRGVRGCCDGHRSVNTCQTRARTSVVQFQFWPGRAAGTPEHVKVCGGRRAACCSIGAHERHRAWPTACARCAAYPFPTSSAPFSISHESNTLLRDPASTRAGSTECACVQTVRMTSSFIAAFKRVCGAGSTSDSMYEGVGASPAGTN